MQLVPLKFIVFFCLTVFASLSFAACTTNDSQASGNYASRGTCNTNWRSLSPNNTCVFLFSAVKGNPVYDQFARYTCSTSQSACDMSNSDGWTSTGSCATTMSGVSTVPTDKNGVDYLAKGTPVDCIGGSIVYVPLSCPVDQMLKYFKAPAPGGSQVCRDGTSVDYPNSCFLRDFLNNAAMAGTKIKNTIFKAASNIIDAVTTNSAKVQHEVQFTNKNTGEMKWGVLEAPAQKAMVADALSAYFKTPASSNLATQVRTATSGMYSVDQSTGLIQVSGAPAGSRGLSPNEMLDVLSRYTIPVSSDVLAPYIDPNYTSAAPDVLGDLQADYTRLTDGDPLNAARFMPNYSLSGSPINLTTTNPLPSTFTPFSMSDPTVNNFSTYTTVVIKPSTGTMTTTGTQTATTTNTSTGSTTATNTSQSTTIDFGAPPPVAKIVNDFDQYLNWLTQALPGFTNNNPDWLPVLPGGDCSYEIHTMIFGRHFDMAPCVPLRPLRVILAWAFSVLTGWLVFRLVFKSTA